MSTLIDRSRVARQLADTGTIDARAKPDISSIDVVVFSPEPQYRIMLSAYLRGQGLRVTAVENAEDLRMTLDRLAIDIAVVDVDANSPEGHALFQELSDRDEVACLALTPSTDPVNRVLTIELGADDCLSKPCIPREVLTRVHSLHRLMSKVRQSARLSASSTRRNVPFGNLMLDLDACKLIDGQGRVVGLTALELQLLRTFAEHPNRALNRDQLSELAHGRNWSPLDRSLDIRISRLRQKIEPDPAQPRVIVTVRGIGYRFDCPLQAAA